MDLFGNTYAHTLLIIGNGFDLAHGMKTSWSDFHKWLHASGYTNLIYFLETNLGMKTELWKNFEKALGECSIDSIYDQCTKYIKINHDHMMRSAFAIEDSPDLELLPRKEELVKSFTEWIKSIWISNELLLIEIPQEARYLTFNYTETLEKLYKIPADNILHIHGNIYNPIFGHGNFYNDNDEEKSETTYQIAAKEKIIGMMNELHKDVQGVIAAHAEFFESLQDIDKIVVRGLSYGDVDFPYFEKTKEVVSDDCMWRLGWHIADDKSAASSMAKLLNLKSELFHF